MNIQEHGSAGERKRKTASGARERCQSHRWKLHDDAEEEEVVVLESLGSSEGMRERAIGSLPGH